MSYTIIVQARQSSKRLPQKVLKPILGKPMLYYLIERLRAVHNANQIVVATTHKICDDSIVSFCKDLKVETFRGPEENVLERYYQAAIKYQADKIIRVTADCPLIDPFVIDKGIRIFQRREAHIDYVSNTLYRSYPKGKDVEILACKP